MNQIILASQSKNRKMIMDSLGIPYVVIPANIDEKSIRHKNPTMQVESIAKAKAEKIAQDYPNAIIIAADSFFVINGKHFEKPETLVEAKKILTDISGGEGIFYTGFCYRDKVNAVEVLTTVPVSFKLRTFSEEEADRYVKNFPVLNYAGGISPHHPEGAALVESIKGSFTAFIYGLPIELVFKYLQKSGVMQK